MRAKIEDSVVITQLKKEARAYQAEAVPNQMLCGEEKLVGVKT